MFTCPNPKNNPKCKGRCKCGGVCYSCANYGRRRSEAAKRKTSESLKGRPKTEEWIRKVRAAKATPESRAKASAASKGKMNPFFGKKHSAESLKKIREAALRRSENPEWRAMIKAALTGRTDSEETRRKKSAAVRGQRNPFYGKRHTEETRAKISEAHKGIHAGAKNPMYGKPCPAGASYGVSGWFEGRYFRSTCELRFLLTHGEVDWVTAETDNYAISYIDCDGNPSYYFPDFFGRDTLVEVKPQSWDILGGWDKEAGRKLSAAVRFCESKGWEYLLVQMTDMSKKDVYYMRERGEVELDPRWERKYQEWKSRQG